MQKFSDYGTGKLFEMIVIILTTIVVEIIYIFNFMALSPPYQTYRVNKTSMIWQ